MSNGEITQGEGLKTLEKKVTKCDNVLNKLETSNQLANTIKVKVNDIYRIPASSTKESSPSGSDTADSFFNNVNNLIDELNQVLRDIKNSLSKII